MPLYRIYFNGEVPYNGTVILHAPTHEIALELFNKRVLEFDWQNSKALQGIQMLPDWDRATTPDHYTIEKVYRPEGVKCGPDEKLEYPPGA